MKICKIWWCGKKHYANGYCVNHYRGVERFGNPYGLHYSQQIKIDAVIETAQLVAQAVIDLAHKHELCPFCQNKEHTEDCAVKLAQEILDTTK